MLRRKFINPHFQHIAWLGVILILLAYALNQLHVVDVGDPMYQIMNVTGAIGILGVNLYERDWPTSVLQIVWASIALIQLVMIRVG